MFGPGGLEYYVYIWSPYLKNMDAIVREEMQPGLNKPIPKFALWRAIAPTQSVFSRLLKTESRFHGCSQDPYMVQRSVGHLSWLMSLEPRISLSIRGSSLMTWNQEKFQARKGSVSFEYWRVVDTNSFSSFKIDMDNFLDNIIIRRYGYCGGNQH